MPNPGEPAGSRATGDGRRETNAAAVLRTVLDHGPLARSAVARLSGLSPAAVSRQVTDLLGHGLLREAREVRDAREMGDRVGEGAGAGTGGGGAVLPGAHGSGSPGRPQIPVDLHVDTADGPVAGGVHLGVHVSTLGLLDLRGRVVARHSVAHADADPRVLPATVAREMRAFLDAELGARPLLGIGAALGGWVDPDRGMVVRHDALGWYHRPLAAELARGLGGPAVRVDNHARAVAKAEILFGRPEARRSLVHLFVGNVVDAALGIAGVVHQGPGSAAGEVAHLPVPDSNAPCRCGRSGCLAATASNRAVGETAYRRGIVPEPDAFLLVDAAATGDRRADRLLRERARAVGRAVALLLDVLNPDLVVVTELASLLEPRYLEEIQGAAVDLSHVCDDPGRIVTPSAGPAVMPVAAGTVLLNPLFRNPLQSVPGRGPARLRPERSKRPASGS
ncbi:ROK family transcriptional regulator [Streptomyces sp. NPDC090025]|uniref:ROK family transcriptional regulator n=1 Tax=Streptomyces sp. NPDC090025 TaxID=3365922 RepID=UPI00383822B6